MWYDNSVARLFLSKTQLPKHVLFWRSNSNSQHWEDSSIFWSTRIWFDVLSYWKFFSRYILTCAKTTKHSQKCLGLSKKTFEMLLLLWPLWRCKCQLIVRHKNNFVRVFHLLLSQLLHAGQILFTCDTRMKKKRKKNQERKENM